MMPGNPGKHHLERQLAESGLQHNIDIGVGLIIGSAISAVGGMIGGNKAAGAARKQAEMANEAEWQAGERVEGGEVAQTVSDLGGQENWQASAGNWVDDYLEGLTGGQSLADWGAGLVSGATAAGQAAGQAAGLTAGQTAGAAAAAGAGYLTADQLADQGFQTAGDVGGLVSQAVDPLTTQLAALDKSFDEYQADEYTRNQQQRAYNQLLIRDAERARVAASYGAGGRPLNKKVKGVRMGSSRDDTWDSRPTFNTFNRGGLRISSLNI